MDFKITSRLKKKKGKKEKELFTKNLLLLSVKKLPLRLVYFFKLFCELSLTFSPKIKFYLAAPYSLGQFP